MGYWTLDISFHTDSKNFNKSYIWSPISYPLIPGLHQNDISVKLTGNLEAVSEGQTRLVFRPFLENRMTPALKRRERDSPAVGKLEIVNDLDRKLHSMPLVFSTKSLTG